MRRKLFTFFLALVAGVGTMFASDTSVDGIWYNFNDDDLTAEVTYQGDDYNSNSDRYSGEVVIPSSVIYNSVTYSVTSIGYSAFAYCSSLTSVTIPNSVTSIGGCAFTECTALTSPVYNAHIFACLPTSYSGAFTIPDGIESIAFGAFYNCYSLTSVTIPNSVTSIGGSAFYNCSSLTSVTIPNSVTSIIGFQAFYNCTGLTSVTIPDSVTSIGYEAFAYCRGLTSVTIGNSVTSIGERAFYNCSGLTYVTCFATTPPQLDSYVFDGVDKSIPLYVPAGSVSAYKSAEGWKDFSNILPIGVQPADVTTTTVTPSETTADIAWPQVTGAATYTIEIKKNGELICTLTFNAQGQLISIAFNAPSRNNAPQRAQAAGFSFTVTSLDSGTTYSYTMTAKDNNGNVLKTESGTFTTTGESQGFEDVQGNNIQCTKVVRNGQIFILRGDHTYTTDGRLVR